MDGSEETGHVLLVPTRNQPAAVGVIEVSGSNLPAECQQFGGDKTWARVYEGMLHDKRRPAVESFEDWVLRFDHMAAPVAGARSFSRKTILTTYGLPMPSSRSSRPRRSSVST